MKAAVVRLSIPAKAEYLILARLALAGIAQAVPMSETVLADLKLAVTEVCGNAVRHAYGPDASPGVVRLEYRTAPDEIEIVVRDDGHGTPEATNGTDVRAGDVLESGMGLAIVRSIMDELTVESAAGASGTVVCIRKRLQ
jgi:serine/threonine-protein kinase RsbW